MSSKKRNYAWFLFLPLILFSALGLLWWGYSSYQASAFQRAYEQGNTYEQLNSLMNTTRYAKEVRKAGYSVSGLSLTMNDRIDYLTTKTEPAVVIDVPMNGEVRTQISLNTNEIYVLKFNSKMKLISIDYSKDEEKLQNNEIPKEDRDKYESFVRKAMSDMLKDVHDSMSS